MLTVAVSAASSTQTTILPTARGALAMAVYGAIPGALARSIRGTRRRVSPPGDGPHRDRVLPGAVLDQRQRAGRLDRLTRSGCSVLLRRSPPSPVSATSAEPCSPAPATSSCADYSRCSVASAWWPPSSWRRSPARPGEQLHHLRPDRRHLRHRHRHARPRGAADDRLCRTVQGVLPRRDAERGHADPGARHRRGASGSPRVPELSGIEFESQLNWMLDSSASRWVYVAGSGD